MKSKLKISEAERKALEEIRQQLEAKGLVVTHEQLLLAVIRAAGRLENAELLRLVTESLQAEPARKAKQ